ncbi:hypothetical protein ACHAXT_009772 [Thalassiosira profunda]
MAIPADKAAAADRARQKAEARRLRILAKADERLDVVSGLAPKANKAAAAGDGAPPDSPRAADGRALAEMQGAAAGASADGAPAVAVAETTSAESKGARRMAAMRRRRYKSKAKEEEADGAENEVAEKSAKPEPETETAAAAKEVAETLPVAVSEESEENETRDDDDDEPQKKYVGVARMRRKRLKEQKAQRLKDMAESEGLQSPSSERELAAERAAMDVTASMVRKGGLVVDDRIVVKSKRAWHRALVPPAKVVPRLVTLVLLFVAGLDLGTQPHRCASPLGDLGARELSGGGLRHLIHHAESFLTRPWEYGMGGRAAHLAGMAPSMPPTALPTAFDDGSMFCGAGDDECLASDVVGDDAGGKKEKKQKAKKDAIEVQRTEDEVDASRARPKGVVGHDDASEFDDADDVAADNTSNIDPLFQVDLDALLANADLPFPVDLAAKLAIGVHRTWVYYLWTLPVQLLTTLFRAPKSVASGWLANPPWILGIALIMRFLAKVVAGDGKAAFHLDPDKKGNGDDDGGGKKGNFDVLGKVVDTAKNYVTSTFPRTFLVLSTLMAVMKMDMYVVLCGMLVGLVGPLAREDYVEWIAGGGDSAKEAGGPPLGDEL